MFPTEHVVSPVCQRQTRGFMVELMSSRRRICPTTHRFATMRGQSQGPCCGVIHVPNHSCLLLQPQDTHCECLPTRDLRGAGVGEGEKREARCVCQQQEGWRLQPGVRPIAGGREFGPSGVAMEQQGRQSAAASVFWRARTRLYSTGHSLWGGLTPSKLDRVRARRRTPGPSPG